MTSCECESTSHLKGVAGQEYAREHLEQLKVNESAWIVLHRCPNTGRLWKEYFPHSDEHGGGSPEYEQISLSKAKEEFGSF